MKKIKKLISTSLLDNNRFKLLANAFALECASRLELVPKLGIAEKVAKKNLRRDNDYQER